MPAFLELVATMVSLRDTPTPTTDHHQPQAHPQKAKTSPSRHISGHPPRSPLRSLHRFLRTHPGKQPNPVAHPSTASRIPSLRPPKQVLAGRSQALAEGVTDAEPYTQHMRPKVRSPNGPVTSPAGAGNPEEGGLQVPNHTNHSANRKEGGGGRGGGAGMVTN